MISYKAIAVLSVIGVIVAGGFVFLLSIVGLLDLFIRDMLNARGVL